MTLENYRKLSVVFINKLLLKHSHIRSFTYCLYFHTIAAELNNHDKGHMAKKSLKYLLFGTLQKCAGPSSRCHQ